VTIISTARPSWDWRRERWKTIVGRPTSCRPRKRFYNDGINIVAGEKNSSFVRAVSIAEATSLVTNLGTNGIGYINGDLTVALSRLPLDDWIGIQGDSHWASNGIAVGTATLFDHQGAFGSGMVTAVANSAAQIDFSSAPFPKGELDYE
jgi:hypothetical protein